ncbi:MAG: GFA family protein [Myxococcota bacterium]
MAKAVVGEGGVDVRGQCYCGAIKYRVKIPEGGSSIFTAYCHCDSCRRAHSAALYQIAAVDEDHHEFTEGAENLQEFHKPGAKVTRAFCRVCGSKMLNRFPGWKPGGKVPVGIFPSTLEESAQHALPEVLQAQHHNCREETVLSTAMLQDFIAHG